MNRSDYSEKWMNALYRAIIEQILGAASCGASNQITTLLRQQRQSSGPNLTETLKSAENH